jgi:TolB-like protein/class 3 adenylate cyclase/cytochrome c-type biogenesis protein CcmH/NrfG
MKRRLAAILAADVVGYSGLMENDEEGTLSVLKAHRQELFDPIIAQHRGRVVKLMGDGSIVEFDSVVDAVACGIAIQKGMDARNDGVEPDKAIAFRVGIHLGDVIVEDDDLYGDGVNIAARLEAVAPTRGICISQQVFDQIETKLDLTYADLGELRVKNIARPIHAYSVLWDESGGGVQAVSRRRSYLLPAALAAIVLAGGLAGLAWWQHDRSATNPAVSDAVRPISDAKSSIAVLPFANLSNDAEQDYFADGMTEDLITDLAKISSLLVIARNSTFAYKGQSVDVRQVARELNVRYVVEGSVRSMAGRVRINAQLIDAETGGHLWAERYDREASDIFALQDDVRAQIIQALHVTLTPSEEVRLERKLTSNADAYDAYLRGLQQESFFTKAGNEESVRLFEKAIELDPKFVAAMGRLASALTVASDNRWSDDPDKSLADARALAEKAVQLDGDLPQAHWALGRVYSRRNLFDGDRALASLRKAIELDPNYADAHAMLANVLHFVGKADEGLKHIETAIRLNPHHPFWYFFVVGANQYMLGDYEAAVASFKKAIERNPNWRPSRLYVVSAYGHLGRVDDAEWEIEELKALGFEPTIANWNKRLSIQDETFRARYFEGLRKLGIPEE